MSIVLTILLLHCRCLVCCVLSGVMKFLLHSCLWHVLLLVIYLHHLPLSWPQILRFMVSTQVCASLLQLQTFFIASDDGGLSQPSWLMWNSHPFLCQITSISSTYMMIMHIPSSSSQYSKQGYAALILEFMYGLVTSLTNFF